MLSNDHPAKASAGPSFGMELNLDSEGCAALLFFVEHINEETLFTSNVGQFVNFIDVLLVDLSLADHIVGELSAGLGQDYSYDFVLRLVKYRNPAGVLPLVSILRIELAVPRLIPSIKIVIKEPFQRVAL